MIIVKTLNGDKFINDKATMAVLHDKAKKEVAVVSLDGSNISRAITDVEFVAYVNDAQPTSWQDEGSHVEELKKVIDKLRDEIEMTEKVKNLFRRDVYHVNHLISEIGNQLNYKNENRTWEYIERIFKEVEENMDKNQQERQRILDEWGSKREKR